ncbi:MAG: hypothetical protein F4X77_16750, partial [Acidobacteriia bacterium]|nr:hypothetical protein [Terriglobia bacterium]
MRWRPRPLVLLFAVCFAVCGLAAEAPRLEPLSGAPPFPADNPPTEAKIRLGEELFFDPILSGGNRRSCGTCHKRELHFMDGLSRAWGLDESELPRKTPGLLNVGWQRSIFFDGRVKTLEEQVSKPLENHREMHLDPAEAVERIRRDPFYVRSFAQAFPGEKITFDLVAKAVASFERTLVSYDSDLDRYLLGDEAALSASAKRGMGLFTGKAQCIRCHNGPLLSDHDFHYTGVAERDGHDEAGTKYKTQSLRDALHRYSYMHNGRMMNIRQVIEHYDRGGSAPESMRPEIRPLGLSEVEKDDLVAFLSALNGRVHRLTEGFPKGPEAVAEGTPAAVVTDSADSGESGAAGDDPSYL